MKTENPIILIVEDNPADVALITAELGNATARGVFRLHFAGTVKEAKVALRGHDIAAVLLDLSLPDSLGLETFNTLAQHSPNTPIVVLTGLDDHELGLRAVRNGAQDYLAKGRIDSVALERTLHFAVERKRRETEIRQRQSLEVMAQFADSIAHEFNNLLQITLGKLQGLEWPLRDDPELLGRVREATQTVLGGATITRRLLAVTGRLPDQPDLLDANAHIAKLCESLRKSFGDKTRIKTELSGGAWPVFADPAQLDMTILTLVNNARDAMLGLGEVTIRTSNLALAEPNAANLPAGGYLMIEITDIGDGMGPDDATLRADPFYNAHADPRLNGLGLNMTQNFIRSSGGHIGVRNRQGQGTTVTLYLPRAENDANSNTDDKDDTRTPPRRQKQIMVVDEDADMRQAMAGFLWQLGYPTYEVSSAADALALLDGSQHVSLVVIDRRGASGVRGDSLVQKMAALHPDLKVLYLTNARGESQPDFGLPADAVAALAKPACLDDLADKLMQLLGEERIAA
ncbi:MAG: response regulator [Woeseia sp.]